MHNLAPIALFVYNRPSHTRKTLESLALNKIASKSELFIFSDGNKHNATPADIKNIEEARKISREKKWCRNVHIIEAETNKGLSRSIISGVTKMTDDYDKVIVLEDDLIVSPFFLEYMNDALTKYEHIDKVMQICGYMFPIKKGNLKDTFFLRLSSSWGWGTWKRAWQYFENDINILCKRFPEDSKYRFNLDGAYDYYSFFKLLQEKKVDSWAIRWYASIFLQNGLCLHPSKSLIKNIGHDDSGVHSKKTNMYDTTLFTQNVDYFEDEIVENPEAIERIKLFFTKKNRRFPGIHLCSFLRQLKTNVFIRLQ